MAYLEPHDKGWMAQVRRKGRPTVSKTFQTKADAEKWARAIEREIDLGGYLQGRRQPNIEHLLLVSVCAVTHAQASAHPTASGHF